MNKMSRREAMTGVLAAGASVLAFNGESSAMQETPALAFGGRHAAKPLPFDPTKLTGISEKLIRSHHENNYTGAVKALNVVEQRLAALKKEKDLPAYIYGDLKRQELIRTGSIVMHETISRTSAATARLTEMPRNSLKSGSAATRHGNRNSR